MRVEPPEGAAGTPRPVAAESRDRYQVNEIFCSVQGEGARAGEASLFVRFSGCNLTCRVETHGFDCDTEFVSGRRMDLAEIYVDAVRLAGSVRWVIFTGGEPLLQLNRRLVEAFKRFGWRIALETNGTIDAPDELLGLIDWIVCSPKVAEHAIRLRRCHELRYVRAAGQAIPRPRLRADAYFVSVATVDNSFRPEDVAWCIELVKQHPEWKLSLQQHKLWGIR